MMGGEMRPRVNSNGSVRKAEKILGAHVVINDVGVGARDVIVSTALESMHTTRTNFAAALTRKPF